MSGAMKPLLYVPHHHCGNVFMPPGDDFVQQWVRHLGNWPKSSEIVECQFCKTAYCTLPISSGVIRDGWILWSLSGLLVRPSINCPHHHLTILESRSWQETISVHPFSSSAVQELLPSQDWNRTALFSHTPSWPLCMCIPVRLITPFLDVIGTYFLDEPRTSINPFKQIIFDMTVTINNRHVHGQCF